MAKWWTENNNSKVSRGNKKKLLQDPSIPDTVNHQTDTTPDGGSGLSSPTIPQENKLEQTMSENQVQMEDGSVEIFGGKKKMVKNTTIQENGDITTKLSFANGRIITFTMPEAMKDRFAAHGADQKFGDVIAGVADVEDCVLAVEELAERLANGEWSQKREGGGMGGTSVLLRALVEHTGKDVEAIKAYLKGKTQAEKVALRQNPRIKPIVDRLEAEKASKSTGVDTDALLDELA